MRDLKTMTLGEGLRLDAIRVLRDNACRALAKEREKRDKALVDVDNALKAVQYWENELRKAGGE